MREHDAFDTPIITPATKAEEGHDEDISEARNPCLQDLVDADAVLKKWCA